MAVQWHLGAPRDIAADFRQGQEQAQRNALLQAQQAVQREERDRSMQLRNALAGSINKETGAIDYGAARSAYIGAGDLSGAMGVDTARHAQTQRTREVLRDNITQGARLARQIEQQTGRPVDAASWPMLRAAAQQAGIDLTGVPEHFDANYLTQLLSAADALADPSAGYTLGEGDVRIGANNQVVARGAPQRPRYYSVPPGGMLQAEPGSGGVQSAPVTPPAVGAVENGYRYRGGDPASPQSWEPVGGQPTSNVAPDWPVAGGAASVPRTFP